MKVQVLVVMFQGLVSTVSVFHSMASAERSFERRFGITYADLDKIESDYAGTSIWPEELVK